MGNIEQRICPVAMAGHLDNRFRRWVQNPFRILTPYLKEGMTALDMGCGPGYFTLAMAQLTGPSGRVIAADLQEGMLDKLRMKIRGSTLEQRISLHQCLPDKIGVTDPVDFILLFYVIHEVPDKDKLFEELAGILNPTGRIFISEPPFHVSKKAFATMLKAAATRGLGVLERPKIRLSKTAVLGHTA